MRRGLFALVSSLLAIIAFAGVNLASNQWLAPVRLDFTGNQLFTLSSSAKTVVQRLVEPIELEFVLSRNVASNFPAIRAHADRVRELLAEIAAESRGKISIRETDPRPFSDDEDRIVAAGLTPAPQDGGDPLYFGVIGKNSVDDAIAIPFLSPGRDSELEYDLVRLIAQLDNPEPAKIAVISSLPAMEGDGRGEGDAFILKEMRRTYDIASVEKNFTALPANADVLMIVHPPKLNDWQLYQIDQFLMRKGRALIALDPMSRIAVMTQGARLPLASSLGPLEQSLGVSVGPEVVADRTLALPVPVDAGNGRRGIEGQPLFIGAPPALMSQKDLVTADLTRSVNFGASGRLVKSPALRGRFTPLIETTPDAALIPAAIAAQGPAPREVLANLKPIDGRQTLAGRLEGQLSTAFPNGPPPPPANEDPVLAQLARDDAAKAPPQLRASKIPAQIVMVADTDVFDDGFYINPQGGAPIADNAAFFLNALDNLTGDEALVELRSRAPAARPMTRVDNLRQAASDRLNAEQSRLQKQLGETQTRLSELETARKAADAAGGPRIRRGEEEAKEIADFRKQAADIRSRLRSVEREFRRDIDSLAGRLELFNVWLPPLVIATIGLAVFALRNRRRRRAP